MQISLLLEDLRGKTKNAIDNVIEWQQYSDEVLNELPVDGGWSVFQCIEHLNLYSEHYIPALKSYSIKFASQSGLDYTPGWLWGRFAKTMLMDSAQLKIKTFRDKEPSSAILDKRVFDTFLHYQNRLLEVLENGDVLDLNRRHIPLSLSPLFKMKLGDGLCLQVYHNQRHINQAQRVLKNLR